jgi:hypothetical protein
VNLILLTGSHLEKKLNSQTNIFLKLEFLIFIPISFLLNIKLVEVFFLTFKSSKFIKKTRIFNSINSTEFITIYIKKSRKY